jgi:hypothetical protein
MEEAAAVRMTLDSLNPSPVSSQNAASHSNGATRNTRHSHWAIFFAVDMGTWAIPAVLSGTVIAIGMTLGIIRLANFSAKA